MRTIEEINKDLAAIQEEERKLFDKSSKLMRELKEAERSELKQFAGKNIRFGKENIMCVDEQMVIGGFVVLKGLIICVDDRRKIDTGRAYGEFSATGSINFDIKMGEMKFAIDEFKDRTLSTGGDIEEIGFKDFMEEMNRLVNKFSEVTSIWGWKSMTNTIIE